MARRSLFTMSKFISHYSEQVRMELMMELTELREERRKRAWDGEHIEDNLRFIDGWIQALEWVLGEEYSSEPAPENGEDASHWHWYKVQKELIRDGRFKPGEDDLHFTMAFDEQFTKRFGFKPDPPLREA
jgi:hypothetical protein